MEKQSKQMEQAEQAVAAAEAELARSEAGAHAADTRLSEEREAAAEASKRKAAADPFQEKAFLAAMRDVELGAAKVAACERLASEAAAQVEATKETARAAELHRARIRLEELRPSLEADGRRLETMVREFRVKACEAVRAHRLKLEELNGAAESAFVPDQDGGPHWFESLSSPWALANCSFNTEKPLGAAGVLAKLEDVVDQVDRAEWEKSRPPTADERNQMATRNADLRRVMQLVAEREEIEAEEARAKERRAMRSESISPDVLDHYRQQAIDAKVARDNPTTGFTGDFAPKVG